MSCILIENVFFSFHYQQCPSSTVNSKQRTVNAIYYLNMYIYLEIESFAHCISMNYAAHTVNAPIMDFCFPFVY